MKNLVRLLLIAVLLAGIFKWEMVKTYALNAKEEVRKYVLDLVQKPEDKAIAESLPPVPPPNVYYTLQRIQSPNPPYGYKTFDAGIPVRKVGEGGGKYIIEVGQDRALVDPVLLTREPKEIARALKLAPTPPPAPRGRGEDVRAQIAKLDEKLAALHAEKARVEAEEALARKQSRGYFGTSSMFVQNEIDRFTAERQALDSSHGKSLPPLVQPASP